MRATSLEKAHGARATQALMPFLAPANPTPRSRSRPTGQARSHRLPFEGSFGVTFNRQSPRALDMQTPLSCSLDAAGPRLPAITRSAGRHARPRHALRRRGGQLPAIDTTTTHALSPTPPLRPTSEVAAPHGRAWWKPEPHEDRQREQRDVAQAMLSARRMPPTPSPELPHQHTGRSRELVQGSIIVGALPTPGITAARAPRYFNENRHRGQPPRHSRMDIPRSAQKRRRRGRCDRVKRIREPSIGNLASCREGVRGEPSTRRSMRGDHRFVTLMEWFTAAGALILCPLKSPVDGGLDGRACPERSGGWMERWLHPTTRQYVPAIEAPCLVRVPEAKPCRNSPRGVVANPPGVAVGGSSPVPSAKRFGHSSVRSEERSSMGL